MFGKAFSPACYTLLHSDRSFTERVSCCRYFLDPKRSTSDFQDLTDNLTAKRIKAAVEAINMPFPAELRAWFPDDSERGKVRALGIEKVNEIVEQGSDDPATIPSTLKALAGLSDAQGNQLRLPVRFRLPLSIERLSKLALMSVRLIA